MNKDDIQAEINAFKILLSQTDYVALKVAEAEMYGEDTTPFIETIGKRREWRRKINELEAELAELLKNQNDEEA